MTNPEISDTNECTQADQVRLHKAGCYDGPQNGRVESAESPTIDAILAFQEATEGLDADGEFGPMSRNKADGQIAAGIKICQQPKRATPTSLATPAAIAKSTSLPSGKALRPAVSIEYGNRDQNEVAYTFDAGSDTGYAAQILDFAKQNGIKVSFGMTGKWAESNPRLVQRMSQEGHHLFNHTYTHDSLTGRNTNKPAMSMQQRSEELRSTDAKIVELTGKSTKPYFRPPFGDYDDSVLRDIAAEGYTTNIMWSVDSFGWKGLSAADICSRVIDKMDTDPKKGKGFIILLHVGRESQDASALPCITNAIKKRGYGFETVPKLMK